MSQSLASVKLHVVFSTKCRNPWLVPELRSDCYQYLTAVAKNNGSHVYEVGGVSDHIHILLTLPRTVALSEFISMLKTSTSRWLKTKDIGLRHFAWQTGYGVFSVSESQIEHVRQYIRNQEIHHRKQTFKNELIKFLTMSNVPYQEQYLLD
ncbi:MAG: IS200/IS605 family transposase [Myxococcota bacterium]